MKSIERLVLAYLEDITGPLLDPLQFAYRANRSVDDAVNMGLHYILQHLDRPGTSPITPPAQINSAICPHLCLSVDHQLPDRQAAASEAGKILIQHPYDQHWRPQGCVLSPLLFSLYTNDCTSKDPSVKLLKFADDTTLIGLIQDDDESAYRRG